MTRTALVFFASVGSAEAQLPVRPYLDWRTAETEHFAFHFPRPLEQWTLGVASRMEAVRTVVGAAVGHVPTKKVHVVVDDPFNLPNGFANPLIDWPLIVLWPTPPNPRQEIGHFREWGEMLAIHEFAHLAHLTWPSRNPWQRALWRLLPAEVGPVLVRSPRWAIEGYATYLEGRLTGSGRPYNVWRPAILRQWALEGRLPTYGQLSSWNAYEGGAFAYLAGSAFLEWLTRREGDSSLVHVWRRLSARRVRSFSQAFSGVYGDRPDMLYGRFTAELTGQALAVEELIADSGGVVAGAMVQRLDWETGDPAIARDGRHVALVLRAERRPPRLVIWRTGPDSVPPDRRRRRARRPRVRDTLDVPDRRFHPPPKRPVATLDAIDSRAFEEPRFFADGDRLLVSRLEAQGDGSLASDLSIWDFRRRSLRRVTRGARARGADPAPDGRTAVATQCGAGRCDLVSVDLATGDVKPIIPPARGRSFFRPRLSPDGSRVAVSVQENGTWRIALLDLGSRTLRIVSPDDGAARYDVAWARNGQSLVWVSELGGIPNLEVFDLATRERRTLTRVTGAALAPEINPSDSSIWFLSLHSRGLDVRRLDPDSARRVDQPIFVPQRFAPAAPVRPRFVVDTLAIRPVARVRPYGFGPRQTRWFPGISATADGVGGEVMINNVDPVGRLGWRIGGVFGEASAWRGGALEASVRSRVSLTGRGYVAQQEPARSFVGPVGSELDTRLTGGDISLAFTRDDWSRRHDIRAGGALASIDPVSDAAALDTRTRGLGYAEARGSYRQRFRELRFAQTIEAHADAGAIGSDRFVRGVVAAAVAVGGAIPFGGFHGAVTYGEIEGTSDPFERFTIGGAPVPLIDGAVLPQRIAMPALPTAVAVGDRVLAFRVALASGPLSPYYWGASAANRGDAFAEWNRVVGAELRFDSESIPLFAIPDVRLVLGYGRPLDPPYRRDNRFYATLTYRR